MKGRQNGGFRFRHSQVRILAPQPDKSLFLHNSAALRRIPADTVQMRGVTLSPYRKTAGQSPDFGVGLYGPILVSRFSERSHRHLVWEPAFITS